MIIEARQLEITTRDVAPIVGETVLRPGQDFDALVLSVVAHWPVMGMWEVEIKGERKPRITITVQHAGFGQWREVAGR